ncbi:MAG: hypothetical protein Q8Q05_03120 [bacterium]|nr:hypothetical protein [bacterium]
MQGEWFLVYTRKNMTTAGGCLRNGIDQVEIPLNVGGREDAAVDEAQAKWAEVLAEASARVKTRRGNNKTPSIEDGFDGLDPNPHLIFIRSIRPDFLHQQYWQWPE